MTAVGYQCLTKIATLPFAFGLCASAVIEGSGPAPNIRTGEWEVAINVKTQGNGFGSDMAAEIAKMPPERRAKMQAMMAKLANRQVTHVSKSCLTPHDLGNMTLTTFFGDNEPGCKSTVVAKSATRWEQTKMCSADKLHSQHAIFQTIDPQHVTGDSFAKSGENSQQTMHMTARWTGPICHKGDDN